MATAVAASAMGLAAADSHKPGSAPNPSPEFNNAADLQSDLNTVMKSIQYQVEQWQTATLDLGTNFTTFFHGGSFVNKHYIEFNTTSISRSEAWLEQYINIKLINHAWWM